MEALGGNENFTVIRANVMFYNYDGFYNKYYKLPVSGTISINHIFTVVKDVTKGFHKSISMKTWRSYNESNGKLQHLLHLDKKFLTERT